jgi:hypothetical protein
MVIIRLSPDDASIFLPVALSNRPAINAMPELRTLSIFSGGWPENGLVEASAPAHGMLAAGSGIGAVAPGFDGVFGDLDLNLIVAVVSIHAVFKPSFFRVSEKATVRAGFKKFFPALVNDFRISHFLSNIFGCQHGHIISPSKIYLIKKEFTF